MVDTQNNIELRDRIYCFPYGGMYAIPAVCTVMGMLLFHIAAFGCKTFKYEEVYQSIFFDDDAFSYSYDFKAGYWSIEDSSGGCIRYNNTGLSGILKFGRFVGIMGSLLSWTIFITMIIASFYRYPHPKVTFMVISIGMGIISILSLLLFVGLADDDNLKVAGGGALAVISAIFWIGGAVSMMLIMKERNRSNVVTATAVISNNENHTKTISATTTAGEATTERTRTKIDPDPIKNFEDETELEV